MDSLPHPPRTSSPRLTAAEREVVLTVADDEDAWTVFTDSTRLTGKLLRVAAKWGIHPERVGADYQFSLPRTALRFVGPQRVSERQRDARRRSLQQAQFARKDPVPVGAGEKAGAVGQG